MAATKEAYGRLWCKENGYEPKANPIDGVACSWYSDTYRPGAKYAIPEELWSYLKPKGASWVTYTSEAEAYVAIARAVQAFRRHHQRMLAMFPNIHGLLT